LCTSGRGIDRIAGNGFEVVEQACQTQTTLRAKKATKTVEGAAKELKNFLAGYI